MVRTSELSQQVGKRVLADKQQRWNIILLPLTHGRIPNSLSQTELQDRQEVKGGGNVITTFANSRTFKWEQVGI